MELTMSKVVILQEYIPKYRTAFFNLLTSQAGEKGIQILVGAGRAYKTQSERRDSAEISNSFHIRQREVRVAGFRVVVRLRSAETNDADLVIMEQARRNLDVYRLFIPTIIRGKSRLALWGHGRDYTQQTSRVHSGLQRLLTRRAAWFFGYTEAGVDHVVAEGVPRERTTVVQNSIDTADLRDAIASVNTEEIKDFEQENDLYGRTALFVGGLDESKRLPFLFQAAQIAFESDRTFRLVVAGDGPMRQEVENTSKDSPYVKFVGSLSGRDKAIAMASCNVLAMPGRVGLIAVDSFAAGLPIVTTNWPWHAPEFDYLIDDVNCKVTRDDVDSFAEGLSSLLDTPKDLARYADSCTTSSDTYTVEAMVENFLDGIARALARK
jgi:glycosyltransferase involved in cell wall biosynthesis